MCCQLIWTWSCVYACVIGIRLVLLLMSLCRWSWCDSCRRRHRSHVSRSRETARQSFSCRSSSVPRRAKSRVLRPRRIRKKWFWNERWKRYGIRVVYKTKKIPDLSLHQRLVNKFFSEMNFKWRLLSQLNWIVLDEPACQISWSSVILFKFIGVMHGDIGLIALCNRLHTCDWLFIDSVLAGNWTVLACWDCWIMHCSSGRLGVRKKG